MSYLDSAVSAYISEHGSIDTSTYNQIVDLFCEYRDESAPNDVQASLGGLEIKKHLSSLFSNYKKVISKYYTNDLFDGEKTKDGKAVNDDSKVQSECRGQASAAIDAISQILESFAIVSNEVGDRVKKMIESGKYAFSDHKYLQSVAANAKSKIKKNITDAADKAKSFLVTMGKVAIHLLARTTEYALKAAIVVAATGAALGMLMAGPNKSDAANEYAGKTAVSAAVLGGSAAGAVGALAGYGKGAIEIGRAASNAYEDHKKKKSEKK